MNLGNGLEIQNAAFRQLWVMMHIGVLNSERNEEEQEYDEDSLPHGTKVLKKLVVSWANTERIVCSDSYFASVTAAE